MRRLCIKGGRTYLGRSVACRGCTTEIAAKQLSAPEISRGHSKHARGEGPKLKVNEQKSAVSRSSKRKFLSFSFTGQREPKRRLAPKAIARFKQRVRELTRRTRGVKVETMVAQLSRYLLGWRRYFGFCQTPWVLRSLDKWLRRRLRSVVWKQWKRGKVRFAELRKRGVSKDLAAKTAGSAHGPWRLSNSPALNIALPNAYFAALGLIPLVVN